MGRHEKINKDLIPEAKQAYKDGDMNFHAAEEMSKLSAEDQKAVYEKTGGKVSAGEVKKEKPKPEKPKNMNIEGFEPKEPPKPAISVDAGVYAIKTTMDMLEKKIAEVAELKQLDDKQGNVEGSEKRSVHINYLGELLEKAQGDLEILEKTK